MCMEKAFLFSTFNNRQYFKCNVCYGIFLNPADRLNLEEETKRYKEHNNDVFDTRYRKFVSPITDLIMNEYSKNCRGLDFGAGTGPVISTVLEENGFNMKKYDPIFINDRSTLDAEYDFIACCEVMEHFFNPKEEFKLLYRLLKKGGRLICMTELCCDEPNFNKWYYINDPTHVFFYSAGTIEWLKNELNFSEVSIQNRLIVFKK